MNSTFSGAGFSFPQDLPDVTFADANPQAIISRMVKDTEAAIYAATGATKTIYPGDPERLLLNPSAYELSVAYAAMDFTGKMNLLKYAVGEYLDNIGAWHGVTRLGMAFSQMYQRFYAEPGLSFAVTIPKGVRVSPDGKLFFATQQAVTIPAAADSAERPFADVLVKCLVAGAATNGFLPGQVSTLVDPQPYVAETTNLEKSALGTDVESDDRYRLRIFLAPEGFSVAGPEGAYIFHTLSASGAIADVAVTSPQPCYISVYPLLTGGELPNESVLDLVNAALSPRDVRPLGDRVSVLVPPEKTYAIAGTYYISKKDSGSEAAIQKAVAQAGTAYALWQKSMLGRDIVPDELISRVRAAGAKRLTLDSPLFSPVAEHEVARASAINLAYGGLENE